MSYSLSSGGGFEALGEGEKSKNIPVTNKIDCELKIFHQPTLKYSHNPCETSEWLGSWLKLR